MTNEAKQAAPKPLVAADVLNAKHPLSGPFTAWLAAKNKKLGTDSPATKRQARKFLAQYPKYRARVATAA
jgi:hypothetical protein